MALVLAHRNDPLGSLAAVRGLLRVLAEIPNVVLLRTDLAAIGAVANGASLGAVGTSTSVRHLVPLGPMRTAVTRTDLTGFLEITL